MSFKSQNLPTDEADNKSLRKSICPAVEPQFPGSGILDSPYIIDWDFGDSENPYKWTHLRKWIITSQLALGTFTVSFSSSSYSGGLSYIERDLHVSEDVAVLGISLYVLGFALGPLVFAPLSEMFGRRYVFLSTYSIFTLFHLGGALGHNTATILTCRLLSGIFGSSPLTNAGGALSDIWNARERGLAAGIYATVPFLGPVIGPIVGGFVAENPHLGWHFNFWLMFILSAITLVLGYLLTQETYAPVLLRWRAKQLGLASEGTKHYVSILDTTRSKSVGDVWKANLSRTFVFLFTEPIVTLLALYISLAFATLYAMFSAFSIVFQEHRSLIPIQNRIYWRAIDKSEHGRAPPEARLHLAMVGGLLIPISLFWFVWTSQPSIHWIVPILAGIPFGIGVATILQSLTAYLMDCYTTYAASAIASTVVLRSLFALAFPVMSPSMFKAMGFQRVRILGSGMYPDADIVLVSDFSKLLNAFLLKASKRYGKWVRSKSTWSYKESDQPDLRSAFSSKPETVVGSSRSKEGVLGRVLASSL